MREKEVWKYNLALDGRIEMPKGARVLSVDWQNNDLMVWALVDPSQPPEKRQLQIVGTGHKFEPQGDFIGTFQAEDGRLVFHLFEGTK